VEKTRYALIGTGAMGHGHIGALSHMPEIELIAVADSFEGSRERARETLGPKIAIYPDHRDLLGETSPDAVIIATPDDTHADIVCECLEAGVHVLSEKPMATNIDDCNRVLEAASRASGIYQIGLELRYDAIWQRVHELIDSGDIGRIRQLWCKEFRGPWNLKVDQWISQQTRTGGALNEKDCHHFDLFNWFTGKRPTRVAGFGSRDLVYGPERFEGVTPTVLDNAQTIVQYEDGVTATLLLCMYCSGYGEGLEIGIVGTEGWLIATTGKHNKLIVQHREKGDRTEETFELPEEVRKLSHGGAVYLEHLSFLENIRTGAKPLTNSHVAWWSTAIPLAAEAAITENRIVDISEFGASPDLPTR
jgi:myo-inositol 2-dehydrogenase / D-chiro-inositol 1-dehydrogenase